ncbi:unnamed protein product [Amoebophrya sp. A120]|nr:unnamed protein product [Amoebophrya sp. A120]|eukprot:GSA120T00019214001.1
MGKSAKFMRVASHEKQKRVLKNKDWRDNGLKQARIDAKREKRSKAALVFGTERRTEKGESGISSTKAIRADPTAAQGTPGGLPFGSDMMAKMRANVAEQAVAKDGNNKPHQSGANIMTGQKPKSKKVKMGKIKLRQAA